MLSDIIHRIEQFHLTKDEVKVISYKPEFAPYLRSYIERMEVTVGAIENFLKRIELFVSIISELKFTNKEMLINRYSGFFFRLTIPDGRFIENERLSSGEQHVIIQLYNMLF